MKQILTKDLSVITTIEEQSLKRLFDKSIWCICDGLQQCIYADDDELEIDLQIGKLTIHRLDNQLKYKFVPSPELEKNLIQTEIYEKNLLEKQIEDNLVKKITAVYKDMF